MRPAVLVHGGAGAHRPGRDGAAAREGCLRAAREAYRLLMGGAASLEAVERAVCMLEDDPQYNAGTGAVANAAGDVELDAAVMEGTALGAGAVAAVRQVPNPVRLARAVLERSPHVLLVGEAASAWARTLGLAGAVRGRVAGEVPEGHGTVGAVAIDAQGRVAAATSTGGTAGKWPGRVGDSPLVGCGTYADDAGGAVSCTGHGESIIRVVLAKAATEAMRAGAPAPDAAVAALALLERVRGDGGLIVVDRDGRLGAAFNTERMAHAWVRGDGREGSAYGAEDPTPG